MPTNSNCFSFPFRAQVTGVLLYFVMIGDHFIRSLELFLWSQSAQSFVAQSVTKTTVVRESFASCLIIKTQLFMWKFFFNHPTWQYNFESMECNNPIFIYIFIIKQVKARGPRRRNKKPIIILYKIIIEYSLKNL